MVKLVRLEKRVVLDGGLVAEIGDAIASSAGELLGKASAESATTLEVMDQVLDSLGDMVIAPINDAVQEGAAELSLLADAANASTLVFVDGNVGDIDLIRAGMAPGAELHIIDVNRDGLTQIADAMAGRRDIGAVHIISHGAPGALSLGNTTVAFDALSTAQQSVLAQMGQAMTERGDILIYGCDFAAGDTGAQAVARMATLTGADVAASVDRTGAADLGGDWDLEVAQGLIQSALVLNDPSQREFAAVLAAVQDITGANFGTDDAENDLNVWLDASNASTINAGTVADGDTVTSWVSQGRATPLTFGLPASTNSATTPDYAAASGGGVVFSGTLSGKDQLGAIAGANGNITGSDYEVFFVGSIDAANSGTSASVVVSFTQDGVDTDFSPNGARVLNLEATSKATVQSNFVAGITAPGSSEVHLFDAYASGTDLGLSMDNGTTTSTGVVSESSLNDNYYNLGGRAFWNNSSNKHNTAMTVNEVIIFDRQLNAAERAIISNYLAEKWSAVGLTISNDYFTGVGDITGAAATDLGGIGQASGDSFSSATSGGLSVTSDTFLANDGDFFMLAHNNGATSSSSDGSIPSESIDYVGRNWSADVTDAGDNGGTVNLVFDLNSFHTDISKTEAAGSYRLIIDDLNDGFDGTDSMIVASAADGSNLVTFSGVSAADLDGHQFTIGLVASDVTSPTISSIAITSDSGAQNNTLNAGDTVNVTVTMDEATNVTGTPQLALNIGGSTVLADYASGTGTTELVFSYTILAGQTDIDGISVDTDSLSLNGGTLRDAALNNATLTHAAVGDNASYLVDTGAPTASVNTATLNGSGNAVVQSSEIGTAYLVNENVAVSSLADITGAADNQFNQVGIAQADTATDLSTAGLADGSYRVYTIDAAGNLSAASSNSVTIDATGPTVSNVAITSASGIQNNRLNAGDVLSVTVTMDEATLVTGTPQLALNIGGSTVQANYAAGSGSTELVFTYTIQAAQTDADGIRVDLDSLSLNGGTLRDATSNNATLAHGAVADDASYLVDTSAPIAPASAPDMLTGSDSGASSSDDITADNTPTFTGGPGSGIPGDTVTVYANGIAVGSAIVAGDGSYSATTSALTVGSYSVTARFTDAAGNESGDSPALTPVVIDTTAPATPTVTTTIASSSVPTVAGSVTLGSGETLTVSVNSVIYTVGDGNLTAGGGVWSLTIPEDDALTEGSYAVTATVTDTAGNATSDTTVAELTIDFTAPAAPTLSAIEAGDTLVSGTAEPGSTLQLTLPGGALRTVTVAGNGEWTISGVGPFSIGQAVIAKAVDAAGNEGPTVLGTATQSSTQSGTTSDVADASAEPNVSVTNNTDSTQATPPTTPSVSSTPASISSAGNVAETDSLFGGSLSGGLRSAVQLSGISNDAATLDGYSDQGLLSPVRSDDSGNGRSGGFGDGFGNIEPSSGRNPPAGEGSPVQDIQRFANANQDDAQLAQGTIRDLGRGDDEELQQVDDATTSETTNLIGQGGASDLFNPSPDGVFGVRAGDFFRIFTEDGGTEGPGEERQEDARDKPPQGVAPVLQRATGQQARAAEDTDEASPVAKPGGSVRQA